MVESFYATRSPGTELVVYVSEDDPSLKEYQKILRDANCVTGKSLTMCEVLNHVSCDLFPGIPYYQEVNDDHVYRTSGWDKILMSAIESRGKGWGIAYGFTEHLPTAVMVSGNIVRTLGYFCYDKIKHMYLDNYLKELGEGIGRFFHVPEVMIEHMHVAFGKGPQDDVYIQVYNAQNTALGEQAYHDWANNHKSQDIGKVLAEIGKMDKKTEMLDNKALIDSPVYLEARDVNAYVDWFHKKFVCDYPSGRWPEMAYDHRVVADIIIRNKIESILEIGTWSGYTALLMWLLPGVKRIKSVDIHEGMGKTYNHATHVLSPKEFYGHFFKGTPVDLVFCDSLEYKDDETYDMIFIDGAHDYEHVYHDSMFALSKKPKVIVWHDYPNEPAVEKFINESGLNIIKSPGSIVVFWKKED
jgi:protein-L-isoaspartate O-methyltransferase